MLRIAGDPWGARLARPPQYAAARATGQRTAHKGRSSLTACDRRKGDAAQPIRTPIAGRVRMLASYGAAEHLPGPGISLPEAHI